MNKLEVSVDNLVDEIKNSDLYLKYQHILKQVELSSDINTLIKDIKALQKRAVKEESLNHNIKELDQTIKDKILSLNSIPLYKDYLEVSEELNEMLFLIKNKMQKYIDDLILN